MYLQDPKVTPFQVGKSGIPPPGVCMRVAREAKRSWKGSRPSAKSGIKSGSSTPTAEAAGPYIEWPHTHAATRGHLRELCKARGSPRNLQSFSNSPAPFGKSINRFWSRRSAPARSPSVFSGSDMAMSLAVCTSDSMQLQGPLAQLTSQPQPSSQATALGDIFDQPRPRLGSPFTARSYGPSSSTGLEETFNVSPEAQRQARTVATRRGLRSSVRLDQGRTSAQKRRSRQPALEPQRTKRPGLGSDFWIDPTRNEDEGSSAPLIQFSSTDSNHHDSLFVLRANLQELFEASSSGTSQAGSSSFPSTTGLTPSQTVPARLGSPFSAKTTSHSFPNRHSSVSTIDVDAVVRPFATVHQTGGNRGNNTVSSDSIKMPLANRLAYIDERLKGFRRRGSEGRRSQSPF
ncbi:uncharacterized protein MAM_01843 [Metarhizium album ARSEF 1941]|uniref:Uncharacterized protein n=1 Tax=Metarhizium album (strain ARSEF 1941) TaxID=1081103 RepID=A0A0B2X3C1_METAS|nr:uncharacterized protein MAM_01843 [Metarhizium album ARSEF 1941]KHN99919.1 hypothetical protein MAM_01843 [Metarhizium album ARSEF 1941]